MKKYFLLFVLGAGLCFGASAQNDKGNGRGKSHHSEKQEKHDDDDDDGNDDHQGRGKHHKEKHDNDNSEGKYSKNAPAKVREAFNRDFPNASNVSWTKSRNIWTARFNGSVFGTNRASYTANGTRVNNPSAASTTSKRPRIFGVPKTQNN